MHRFVPILLASLMLLPACGRGRLGGGGGGDDDDQGGSGLVSGLDIVRITINQGVEVDLVDGETEVSHNAPVVANRPGIMRIYVEPQDSWDPREVIATLTLDDDSELSVSKSVSANASSEGQLNSTINIEFDGEFLNSDVGFSVRLEEAEGGSYEGNDDAAIFPRDDEEFADLDVRSAGIIDLRIIPIRYNADNSGRMPATNDAAIQRIVDGMMAFYPATEVRVTVDNAYDYNWGVNPNGSGWSELLQDIYGVRAQRNHPGSSYTYGLFAPANDRWEYCGGGCVAGLSVNVENANWSDSRVSIGLGFDDDSTVETMVHEVGHAHGRSHAPCTQFGSIQGVDPSFPYSDGGIGVTGYDVVDGSLKSSTQYYDVMGYCDPNWISDYTFEAFFNRIRTVGPSALLDGVQAEDWMTVLVDGDRLHSPQLIADAMPVPGADAKARMLDANGVELDELDARYLAFDHVPGGMLVFPAPAEGVSVIDVPGYGSIEL